MYISRTPTMRQQLCALLKQATGEVQTNILWIACMVISAIIWAVLVTNFTNTLLNAYAKALLWFANHLRWR